MEFFDAFFNEFYGHRIPGSFYMKRSNMLRNMDYELTIQGQLDKEFASPDSYRYFLDGSNESISKGELEKAYAAMTFVDTQKMNFKSSYQGQVVCNAHSGWLSRSDIIIEEFVCPTLQSRTEYHLKAK